MKAVVAFPPQPIGVAQIRHPKRVRLLGDAHDRYSKDPRWLHQGQDPDAMFARLSVNTILSKIQDMECRVVATFLDGPGATMYVVALPEVIQAPDCRGVLRFHDLVRLPADYFATVNDDYYREAS